MALINLNSPDMLTTVLLAGGMSFLLCCLFMPGVIKFARYKGWVVQPRADRWHTQPTALMGGIGIYAAFACTWLATAQGQVNWTLFLAVLLMFLTGLVDDLRELKPVMKLLAQIACSFVLIYHGYTFGGGLLGWAGIPLTFIWVIGITNAINLLDNMDGLAGGISGIISISCGVLAVINGLSGLATIAFCLAGASCGFLIFNFKPAKIFMGDAGSLFMGFTLSFLSIAVQGKLGSSSAVLVLLVPISVMSIPIMDTTLVTIKRLAAGRRVDQGGRDHTSHRLVAMGLSEKKAVLTLYGICATWGLACVILYQTQFNNLLLCVLLLAIFSVVFAVLLSNVKVYNETEEKLSYLRLRGRKADNKLTLRFFLYHKKLILGVSADVLIIYGAFLIAQNALHISDVHNDYVVLATFIAVKISLFYLSRLYYRMWRYMEVTDVAGYLIFTGIADAILLVVLFLKGKLSIYQPNFFLLDFLLTFTGLICSRLFYRWVNDTISRNRTASKNVLIYGAGDRGYLLIKELLQNHRHELRPVGWIDDDETKLNRMLYGYRILGGKDKLTEICEKVKPDIIMISTDAISAEDEEEIRELTGKQAIQLGRFAMSIQYN